MVMLPVRAGPGFAATTSCTCPGPVRLYGEAATHPTLLAAVHEQPAAVATSIVVVSPTGGASSPDRERQYPHPLGCVTVTERPAPTRVQDRSGPVLAATVRST